MKSFTAARAWRRAGQFGMELIGRIVGIGLLAVLFIAWIVTEPIIELSESFLPDRPLKPGHK